MSLVLEALGCARSGRQLFAPVCATLGPGEALILRGPNGSGKTTLLRAVAGLMPFEGRATFDGKPVSQAEGAIAYAGHQDTVKPSLTVAENLAFWADFVGGDAQAAAKDFDLATLADRPAGRLSAGQRRRLGLARLVLTPARLWLLDEPTNSLDDVNSRRLTALVRAHLDTGGLAIIATHIALGLDAATLRLRPSEAATSDPFLEGSLS